MSHFSKFLPVVALAAALAAPLTANARSVRAPEAPAQQQVLVGQYASTQPQGRASEINAQPAAQLSVVSAPEYAAASGGAPAEVN